MYRKIRGIVCAALAATVTLLGAGQARAQGAAPVAPGAAPYVETKTATGSEVWFPVDKLSAPGIDASSLVVKGRPGGARMGLMRPRYQFVTEMLKSVEAM